MVEFEELEIWDHVKDYEGLYKISSKGRVWSIRSDKILKQGKDKDGYCLVNLFKQGKQKTFRVHRLVAFTFYFVEDDTLQIDHRDRNKTNNNLLNLRFCTLTENNRNQGIQRNNNSGYKGVGWSKCDNKWRARIFFNGKRKHLGLFNTREEAHEAYKRASKEYYKEYSYTQ